MLLPRERLECTTVHTLSAWNGMTIEMSVPLLLYELLSSMKRREKEKEKRSAQNLKVKGSNSTWQGGILGMTVETPSPSQMP